VGQGKYGSNLTPHPASRFKRAFEIDAARKTAAVNYCSVP
jgi:hypothetical protein